MFYIENKEYNLQDNFLELDSFEIKSHPQNYSVEWDKSASAEIFITKLITENTDAVFLIDRNVFEIYNFKNLGIKKSLIINAIEENKTIDIVISLVDFLSSCNFTKADTLIVIGGGIIQDIAAFTAKSYKRGINWIFVPTTLLSMCDSCIGGKCALNHGNTKNQLALFSAPSKVIINSNFLKTLGSKEIKSGFGEILKLGITGGEDTFNLYRELVKKGNVENFEDFKPLILMALHVKKVIIEDDEFESGLRQSLNYGHTIGHALEILSNYELPHGQAVALGIILVNRLNSDEIEREKIELLASDLIDNININIDPQKFQELLRKDKKTLGNKVKFITINIIGDMNFLELENNNDLLARIK